jgi:signal transduction histidine kinase
MAAAAGAAIALSVAAATGMPRHELVELGLMLGPGLLLIVLIAWAVMREEARRRERSVEVQRRDLVIAVSHDLRTPLSSMRAIAEAIDEKVVGDPATLQRYAAEMRRSAEALTTLVDDLFELVQLESGAISLGTERASLSEVVGAAVAACDGQAVEKGLRHTPAEGTVRVEARQIRGALEVAVEDSGQGIAKADLERVFEPFWRGDAARSDQGSGLGLAVSKRIVEALGGAISVHSEPSRGSRFEVLLPEGG